MPSGYRDNLVAWCETSYPSSYSVDQLAHYTCLRSKVQVKMAAIPSGYRSAVSARVSAAVNYDEASLNMLYQDLLHGTGGVPSSLAEMLRTIFQEAYDECCCAVSPGPFLGWLSSELEVRSRRCI